MVVLGSGPPGGDPGPQKIIDFGAWHPAGGDPGPHKIIDFGAWHPAGGAMCPQGPGNSAKTTKTMKNPRKTIDFRSGIQRTRRTPLSRR